MLAVFMDISIWIKKVLIYFYSFPSRQLQLLHQRFYYFMQKFQLIGINSFMKYSYFKIYLANPMSI